MNSDEIEQKCENCRFYKPDEGRWDGTCTNPNIPKNVAYKMHAGWPKRRADSTCDLFEPKIQ